MFRSFFPSPVNFFISAVAWTAVAMTLWFTAGPALEPYLSLGPWLAVHPTPGEAEPFFDAHRVWLYQYVILAGYLFCVPWAIFNDNRRWYWWSVVGSVTIFEVMDVAARADLKSDVLKDLDRQRSALGSYRGNPAISETALAMAGRIAIGLISRASWRSGMRLAIFFA